MPGIGRKAAGRIALRRCENVGMRFTMEPEVCCGKSDARATGRKAARKEREGTAEIAAMVGDVGWIDLYCD
jgi:Fe-S oxidoreductase